MKIAIAIVVSLAVSICVALMARQIFQQSSDKLLTERQAIEAKLDELAAIAPAIGTGPSGCMFTAKESAESGWIEFEWPTPQEVNEVIIVPTLLGKFIHGNVITQGWPREIRLTTGDGPQVKLASQIFSQKEASLPAPRVFRFPEVTLSRLRIEIGGLVTRPQDGAKVLHLSEILVSGTGGNVAKAARLSVSPSFTPEANHLRQLVDGRLPYEMIGTGGGTQTYRRFVDSGETIELAVKLAKPVEPHQIALFPSDRSIRVPWSYRPGTGFPRSVRIIAADNPDFGNAQTIVDQDFPAITNTDPVVLDIEERPDPVRYVRFFFKASSTDTERQLCSLAEIQILENGKNAAIGATVFQVTPPHQPKNRIASLFDGKNRFGNVLGVQEWMRQLAERQTLELRLAEIELSLNRLHDRNGRIFHWTIIIFVCLSALASLLYVYQITRLKALALESQELLLAELHDEVGASLHAIRMFAEIAHATPEADNAKLVGKIHRLATESAESVRRVTHLLDEGVSAEDFIRELREHAKWLPARCAFDLDLNVNETALEQAEPSKLGHLLRFYHECLANVNRHATGVTKVTVTFSADSDGLMLSVANDGNGPMEPTKVPSSLVRRAKLAGGRATASPGPDGSGFQARIVVKRPPWWGRN